MEEEIKKKKKPTGRRKLGSKKGWVRIDFQVTPDMHEALIDRAKKTGVTKSVIIRMAIQEYLELHPEAEEYKIPLKLEKAMQIIELIISALEHEETNASVTREETMTTITLHHADQLAHIFGGKWTDSKASCEIASSILNLLNFETACEPILREIPVENSKRKMTERVGFSFYITDKITHKALKEKSEGLIKDFLKTGMLGDSVCFL